MSLDNTTETIEEFHKTLPDEIDIRIKMDKNVFIRMHQLTLRENGSSLMSRECRGVWGWLLETIVNFQKGVRFFYENGTKRGSPSIRFLDNDGKDIDVKTLIRSPYQ